MSVVRIIHAADLHLDSPFEALSAERAARRRSEQRLLLTALCDLVRREDADMLLLAGDLLDSDGVYSETARQLSSCLSGLDVPVFISPGNHDRYRENSVWNRVSFGSNVHIFRKNEIECVRIRKLPVYVFGAAFTDRNSGPLLKDFSVQREDGMLNIMCIHGDALNPDSPYNPVRQEELAQSGMDYVALGHIHRESGLRFAGECCYAWPGCPEGRGFDETGDKFVYVLDIDTETRRTELRREQIALRRYENISVDVSDSEPLLAIHSAIGDDPSRDIYRITLTGETETPPDTGRLYAGLEGLFFSLQIRDATRIKQDIWERAGEDSLRGLFLARLKKLYDAAADDGERIAVEQAARWGLAALDNSEEVVHHGY